MNFLANRLAKVQPSATIVMAAKAMELRAAGHDIIALSAGEPDFDTPKHIIDALQDATIAGKTRYANVQGLLELRKAICEKFQRENGVAYEPEDVIVSAGGKNIIFNAMCATLNAGDEVIIPAPYWVSYNDIVALFDAKAVIIDCKEDVQYKLTPQMLESAITAKTKWLMLNSPSNPTGALYSAQELAALADILRQDNAQHIHILCDDIYEHVLYEGVFATMAQIAPDLKSRILTLNGLSKAYCMTGWRIGYAAGDRSLIKAITKVQGQSVTSPTTMCQWAAIAALQGDQSFIKANNQHFQRRRDMIVDAMNAIDGITCQKPPGAFYVYPSCAGMIGKTAPDGKMIASDEDFCTYLLEHAKVAVVHGGAFGLSPHFRISYAASNKNLKNACARIVNACNALI